MTARFVRVALALAMTVLLASPTPAKTTDTRTKSHAKVAVHPHRHWHGYGFLPGYHQPPNLYDWHDRSGRHGDLSHERRYLNLWTGQWDYGWGGPRFFHGQWNGGGFGPCWTWTPIGMMPTCGK